MRAPVIPTQHGGGVLRDGILYLSIRQKVSADYSDLDLRISAHLLVETIPCIFYLWVTTIPRRAC